MWNQYGGDMGRAMNSIPKDTSKDSGYSTPDVYGRAAQFYLSLQSAAEQSVFTTEEVRIWRGLLTMLALRNVLSIPLRWESVNFTSNDLLSDALAHPPMEKRQLIYPDERPYQWDGKSFYVLTWAPNGIRQCDLAIYSPMTLLHPVADWRRILYDTSEMSQVLRKFFYRARTAMNDEDNDAARAQNISASTFRNDLIINSLQDGERKLVYFWLRAMRANINGNLPNGTRNNMRTSYLGTNSEAKVIVGQHLDRFMLELQNHDGTLTGAAADNLEWAKFPEYTTTRFTGLPSTLISAYSIPGGPLFADQVCYFQVEHNSDNPFEPCNYSANYKIGGQLDSAYDLYAFLPIHPSRQKTCLKSGLAESVRMSVIPDPGGDTSRQFIRVSARLKELGDFPLERDYLISPDLTDNPDTAICYKFGDSDEDAVLDYTYWPLIAVWPDVIGTGWNEYYVMRTERISNRLQIYNETQWAPDSNAPATRGSNDAVVKTTYVPDAIPFVREVLRGRKVSVGMVTPQIPPRQEGKTVATVAVDFGTTATRVFYSMVSNPGVIQEVIPSTQDKPLEVTKLYDDSSRKSTAKYEEMAKSFISPRPPKIQGAYLLSIFRRSEAANKSVVPPLLEGVIYHPENYSETNNEDFSYLVTDLKWSGEAGPYYKAFMQQLCIHIMSILYRDRGVNALNWVYALPKAMEDERGGTDRVRDIWKNLGDFLNKTGGNIQSTVMNPLTESVAASRYFAVTHRGEINKKKGYLVVDIGGGTTDVALWWSRDGRGPATLQWHTSVRIAGRTMFTSWLEYYLADIALSASDTELKLGIDNILNHNAEFKHGERTALVDMLLSSYSEEIKEDYSRLWDSGTTPNVV